MDRGRQARSLKDAWPFALFVLPLASIAYPPLYDHRHPVLAGVPFFVWYQIAAIVFGAIVTAAVYVLRR